MDEDVWQRTVTVVEAEKDPPFKLYRPDGKVLVPKPKTVGFDLPKRKNK